MGTLEAQVAEAEGVAEAAAAAAAEEMAAAVAAAAEEATAAAQEEAAAAVEAAASAAEVHQFDCRKYEPSLTWEWHSFVCL